MRADVFVATEYEMPQEDMTLRNAIQWYKKVVNLSATLGTPTGMEVKHINDCWQSIVDAISEREGVPSGYLTYMLSELTRTEMRAAELAEDAANGPT